MTYEHFTDMHCWQACRDVVRWIWSITRRFPPEERYDLVRNMNRAARSTTRNIAEGFGKYYYKENIRFCRISLASLFELMDELITCEECGYITATEHQEGLRLLDRAKQLVRGYIRYLKSLKERED